MSTENISFLVKFHTLEILLIVKFLLLPLIIRGMDSGNPDNMIIYQAIFREWEVGG